MTIDPAVLASLDDECVYHQGPQLPPKPIVHPAVAVPAAASPSRCGSTRAYVIVSAVISSEGAIGKIQILRECADEVLVDAVVRGLREWRFEPAELDGQPVAAYYNLIIPLVWSE